MSTSARQIPADRVTRTILTRNPEGEFWQDTEVPFIVRQHRDSAVRSSPAALCTHVDAWAAGSEQYDDMTVVVLRVQA